MNNSEDNGVLMFLGGILAVIFIGGAVIKAVGQFFKELAIAFHNFGNMAGAFIPMAWNVFLVIALIALTLSAIACGVYFSWKYIKKVSEIMEMKAWLQGELTFLEERMIEKMKGISTDLSWDITRVRNYAERIDAQLTEAIKVTKDVAPPKAEMILLPEPEPKEMTENTSTEDQAETDIETDPNTQDPSEETVTVSNPY